MDITEKITTPSAKIESLKPVTSMLFNKAYGRIWSGRSIKAWEWIFWVPLMLVLGFRMFGFSSYYIEAIMYGLSWVFIQIVPVFVIPSWINMSHAQMGKLDDSLRSVPIKPSGILQPRVKAVLISAVQIFTPASVLVLIFSENFSSLEDFGNDDLFKGALQILGWIIFLTMWGFAAASIIARRGGNFFLWYFTPGVIVILIVIPLLIGNLFTIDSAMLLPEKGVFGLLYAVIGIGGLVISPFIYGFACKKWGERTG